MYGEIKGNENYDSKDVNNDYYTEIWKYVVITAITWLPEL